MYLVRSSRFLKNYKTPFYCKRHNNRFTKREYLVMKNIFYFKFSRKLKYLAVSLFVSAFFFAGCSSSQNMNNDSRNNPALSNEKSFSFYYKDDGQTNYWKVNFIDGKISTLYKNGERIPGYKIDDYKDMIYKNLGELTDDYIGKDTDVYQFNFDSKHFKDEMKKMKKETHKHKFNLDFDKDKFKKQMKHLTVDLQKLKDKKIIIKIDTSDFNINMDELKANLEKLKEDSSLYNFNFNMDDFNNSMKEFNKKMKNFKVELEKIDLDDLRNEIERTKDHLDKMHLDMSKVNKDLRKFNLFIKDLRKELVQDNVIKNKDEDFNMNFNSDEIVINGKKLPDSLHKKYIKLYKDHFGKDLDDEIKINVN